MTIQAKFRHYNFNVQDLGKALDFYDKALGLKPIRERTADDGSFKLVFLGDGQSEFDLELTWLRDWDRPYELGDNEVHLCMSVPAEQYEDIWAYHKEQGWVCYENQAMNLYFIADPDNHWIEMVPDKR